MKKLNKKGVTLIELIVSFAIVSIAMIYFYQTIVDLHRMYKNSNKATDEFVNKDYALRVLDAWATKSDNNLSDLLSTASAQVTICDMYNMACDDSKTKYENDGEFKKITLINNNEELAVYYKYEKTLVDLKLERAGALDEFGNVNSYDNMLKTLKEADDDIVTVGFEGGIIKYEITDKKGEERYTKTNTNTINEIIERDENLTTEVEINNKVQKLVGTEYTIKESVEEIKPGVYASVYNIVDKNGTTMTTNVKKTNDLIRYDNKNASADIKNLFNEINPNGTYDFIYNNHINEFYSLKFELTSTENEWCYAVLCNGLRGSCADGNDYYVDYYLHEIKNSDILEDLVKQNKINVKTETIETGKYYLTYSKFKNNSGINLDNHYIKVYNFAGTKNACKMKLVEAYKYK